MQILVIGYYNQGNLGDDAYQGIMGRFFPDHELIFVSSTRLTNRDPRAYDAIIVGGGDLINDYFNQTISPFLKSFHGPKIAFSIGIPFPSLIKTEYLEHFDHVFTRNYEDLRALQRVLGSHRAHFIPDIALNYHVSKPLVDSANVCGVFLVGNLIQFPSIVEDIAHLIAKTTQTHEVILYLFHPAEDVLISTTVQDLAVRRFKADSTRIRVDSTDYTAQQMINLMSEIDFAICMRYHSHVFCTVAGIPFMSISSTRKTRSYMTQAGLKDYQYEIVLNGHGTPIRSNYSKMRDCWKKTLRHRNEIQNKLGTFLEQSRFLLTNSQALRLISIRGGDIRSHVANFIQETGDHQNGARLLSSHLIGYPDSPYVWGMYEKFKNAGEALLDTIHSSAQFLIEEGESIGEEILDFFTKSDLPIYVDLREYQSYKHAHRGGWYLVCEELARRSSQNHLHHCNGMICDMYVDRTFHWARSYMKHRGIIPYTGPWCGFIHHTPDTTYSPYNTRALLDLPEFRQSLPTCQGLFVLSESLAQFLRQNLHTFAPHVKVITFTHPVIEPSLKFDYSAYTRNIIPQLINIGAWMRNPFSIYRVPPIPLQKTVLVGKDMGEYIPPEHFRIEYGNGAESSEASGFHSDHPCRPSSTGIPKWVAAVITWLESINVEISHYTDPILYIRDSQQVMKLNFQIAAMISSVKLLEYQSNEDYDTLLSQNIVFLDLIDAAAVNTIIECIIRHTPVIVNRIPGTVALLGEKYPLYYQDVREVPQLLQPRSIKAAISYLRKLDDRPYSMKYFIKQMTRVATKLDKT